MHLYQNGNDIVPDLPLGWCHAGPLEQVGTLTLPWPNVQDHRIARVVAAFPTIELVIA